MQPKTSRAKFNKVEPTDLIPLRNIRCGHMLGDATSPLVTWFKLEGHLYGMSFFSIVELWANYQPIGKNSADEKFEKSKSIYM